MSLRDDWRLLLLFIVLAVAVVAAAIHDENACRDRGGHFVSKSAPGVGVSTDGNVVPTFSTVSFCVSADGRILE